MKTNIMILLNSYHNSGPSNVMKSIANHINRDKFNLLFVTLLDKNSESYRANLKDKSIHIIELNFKNKRQALLKGPYKLKKLFIGIRSI